MKVRVVVKVSPLSPATILRPCYEGFFLSVFSIQFKSVKSLKLSALNPLYMVVSQQKQVNHMRPVLLGLATFGGVPVSTRHRYGYGIRVVCSSWKSDTLGSARNPLNKKKKLEKEPWRRGMIEEVGSYLLLRREKQIAIGGERCRVVTSFFYIFFFLLSLLFFLSNRLIWSKHGPYS